MASKLAMAVIGGVALSALSSPALAQNKCVGAKIKAASKKASCLLGLEAKEASKGEAKDPAKAAACGQKMIAAFGKAEAKGGCLTTRTRSRPRSTPSSTTSTSW